MITEPNQSLENVIASSSLDSHCHGRGLSPPTERAKPTGAIQITGAGPAGPGISVLRQKEVYGGGHITRDPGDNLPGIQIA
jgi:hypothetical protein